MDIGTDNNHNKGNLTDYIYSIAKKFPDNYAILHPKKITFNKLCLNIDSMVSGLINVGIRESHQVLLLVSPGAQMFTLVFALLRMGAIPIMIDPGMGAKAMSKALAKIKIDVFIGEPKVHLLRFIYPQSFKHIICSIVTRKTPFIWEHSLSSICSKNPKPSIAVNSLPSDKAAIFFTSGSTGPAKAVLYRNQMLHAQIDILRTHYGYGINEIDCCTFPLTGLLVMCLGLAIVFADMNMAKPSKLNPKKLIENILEYNCTHLFCSPMVLKKLSSYGNYNNIKLPSLKRVMTAGAEVPNELLISFRRILSDEAEIHTPFGSTEALPVTDITDNELIELYTLHENAGICIGYPLHGVEIKVIEINDDELSDIDYIVELDENMVGELIVKGKNVTQEYLGLADARYSKIWDKNKNVYWHRMGDLGRKDNIGRYWYCGRKSHRVITKEGVLTTTDVEYLFNEHPKVERSALIGIPDNDCEFSIPAICIQLKEKATNKKKKLITAELAKIANKHHININTFYYYNTFPVDPRHNAKINREKLTTWSKK